MGTGHGNLSEPQNVAGTPLSCREESGQVFRLKNLSKIKQIFLSLLKPDNPPSLEF